MAVTMGWGLPRLVDYSFYYDMIFQAPIMDFRVRELAAHIPSKLKVVTEVDKYIFRKAIKNNNLLPDEIINQPKTAFGLSIRDVIMPFMFNRDMENYLQDIIDGISPDLKQYMDIGFIERCIKSGELKHKFALLIFSSWYDCYINS
jgi:hypothetical protein